MTVTIFFLWQLVAGKPVDVDAFLSQPQCLEMAAGLEDRLKLAIAQTDNAELKKYKITGCHPMEINVPNLVAL